MKILAFADLHGSKEMLEKLKEKADEADVLVGAGDYTIFEDKLDEIIEELDSIGKPVILTHGNHESDVAMREKCRKTKNIKFIHEDHHEKGRVLFLGYGGGGFSFETEEFHPIGDKFKKTIKKDQKVVFVIHAPPYDTNLDEVLDDHVGNITMREFVEESQPDLVICGHIHENFGREDKIGNSLVVNPGPEGKILDV